MADARRNYQLAEAAEPPAVEAQPEAGVVQKARLVAFVREGGDLLELAARPQQIGELRAPAVHEVGGEFATQPQRQVATDEAVAVEVAAEAQALGGRTIRGAVGWCSAWQAPAA